MTEDHEKLKSKFENFPKKSLMKIEPISKEKSKMSEINLNFE
jgi:hypothetical protein